MSHGLRKTQNGRALVVERGYSAEIDRLAREGLITLRVDEAQPYGSRVVGRAALTRRGRHLFGSIDLLVRLNGHARRARILKAIRVRARMRAELDEVHATDRDLRVLREMGVIIFDRDFDLWRLAAAPSMGAAR